MVMVAEGDENLLTGQKNGRGPLSSPIAEGAANRRPTAPAMVEVNRMVFLLGDGGGLLESKDCEWRKPCLKFKRKQRFVDACDE